MATIDPQELYQLLKKIPKSKVITYKSLAEALDTKGYQAVGQILHRNTDGDKYPCHRVVKSDMTLASGYAFGGAHAQWQKLKTEGVIFEGSKVSDSCVYTF